ncbi:MAG: VOC family protein [Cyanobacteriota bacterium]|nr:VOC family protein [Cyanobacteriota bacterium]
MEFNHLHLYVDDLAPWRQRFLTNWAGTVTPQTDPQRDHTALIYLGQVPLLLSDRRCSAVQSYLHRHPPGIGDLALRVGHLETTLDRLAGAGGKLHTPIEIDALGRGRWCQVQGWGSLRHTLIESCRGEAWVPDHPTHPLPPRSAPSAIDGIDHAVLNVSGEDFPRALAWYVNQLGFQPQQRFTITTPWSGLQSVVLAHPQGGAQLPVNQPTDPNSQIQEFLHWNRGAGIQHVALHTSDILHTVDQLKRSGVEFIDVPPSYYQALAQRPSYQVDPTLETGLNQLKILMDWDGTLPQARLLQTFTQPLLDIPTLFFEVIQRQVVEINGLSHRARGFGQGNFQALFEAIEAEQRQRRTLDVPGQGISEARS